MRFFLRCGRTIACLRLRGTVPDERERFMIFVIVGKSEPTTSFNSLVVIMSSLNVEFLAAFITLSISSSVNSSKAGNVSSYWAHSWFSTSMVGDFASIFCLITSCPFLKNSLRYCIGVRRRICCLCGCFALYLGCY